MIDYRIDRRSGTAAHLQIVRQTEQALRTGTLQAGDEMPTAPQVVAAAAVRPEAVTRAYRLLECAGVIEARGGTGMFVRPVPRRSRRQISGVLREELTGWVTRARAAGLDREDIVGLVGEALDASAAQGAYGRHSSYAPVGPAGAGCGDGPRDRVPDGHPDRADGREPRDRVPEGCLPAGREDHDTREAP